MVGTTRPRIGIFLKKFRALGLIRLNEDRCLVIEEAKLEDYLLQDPSDRQSGEEAIRKLESRHPSSLPLSPIPEPLTAQLPVRSLVCSNNLHSAISWGEDCCPHT